MKPCRNLRLLSFNYIFTFVYNTNCILNSLSHSSMLFVGVVIDLLLYSLLFFSLYYSKSSYVPKFYFTCSVCHNDARQSINYDKRQQQIKPKHIENTWFSEKFSFLHTSSKDWLIKIPSIGLMLINKVKSIIFSFQIKMQPVLYFAYLKISSKTHLFELPSKYYSNNSVFFLQIEQRFRLFM